MIFDPSASTIAFTPEGGAEIAFTNLKDIDLPEPEVDDLDATTRTSLAASTQMARSFAPGLLDNGEFTFQMQPEDATDITDVTSNVRVQGAWVLSFNGVVDVTFDGYIKGYTWPDPLEEQGVLEVTVKVSGDVAVAAAAS